MANAASLKAATLAALHGAIGQAAVVLTARPDQCFAQLFNRLQCEAAGNPGLADLLERARRGHARPWLRLHTPLAYRDPFIRALAGHDDEVIAVAGADEGRCLLSGGADHHVCIWDVETGRLMARLDGFPSIDGKLEVIQQGRRFVYMSAGGLAVHDAASGSQLAYFRHEGITTFLDRWATGRDGEDIAILEKPAWNEPPRRVTLWHWPTNVARVIHQSAPGWISDCRFSPDGRLLAVFDSRKADASGVLWLFRFAADGTPTRTEVAGHWFKAYRTGFSEDGLLLAAVCGEEDDSVTVCETTTGRLRFTHRAQSKIVLHAFVTAGNAVLVVERSGQITLLDRSSGRQLAAARSPDRIAGCAFDATTSRLACAEDSGALALWELAELREHARMVGHGRSPATVVFNPQGTQVASSGNDLAVRVWDASTGEEVVALKGHTAGGLTIAFLPGDMLASGSDDKSVRLWRVGRSAMAAADHRERVTTVAFGPAGRRFLSAGWDATVRIRDADSGALVATLEAGSTPALACGFSPDGAQIAAGSLSGEVRWWRTDRTDAAHVAKVHDGWTNVCVFSPDGRRMASAGRDGLVVLWSVNDRTPVATLAHDGIVSSCAFSPDSSLLLSASYDSTVRIWDATTGEALGAFTGHQSHVESVAFSPDGALAVSCGWDRVVRVWNPRTLEPVAVFSAHTDVADRCGFTADGRQVVSSGWDGHCFVFEVGTGAVRADLGKVEKGGGAWALFPDGRHVLIGAKGQLGMWAIDDAREVASLSGLTGLVTALAVSACGRRLAIGTEDGSVLLASPENLPVGPPVVVPVRRPRLTVVCPYCAQAFQIGEQARGAPLPCPRCGQTLAVSASEVSLDPRRPPQPEGATAPRADRAAASVPGSLAAVQRTLLEQLGPEQYAALTAQYKNLPFRPADTLRRLDESASPPAEDLPSPHPAAEVDQAARANLEYQASMRAWRALPWWKRMRGRPPEPPKDASQG